MGYRLWGCKEVDTTEWLSTNVYMSVLLSLFIPLFPYTTLFRSAFQVASPGASLALGFPGPRSCTPLPLLVSGRALKVTMRSKNLIKVLVAQSCPTLCNPMGCSLPGSSVHGILQARTLEWAAISFSNACIHAKSLQSCLTLCDPIDGNHQAAPSLGFSRQEHWSGLPFPSPMHAYMLSHFSRVRLCVTP